MKPSIPIVVQDLAERLRSEIVPELTGFRANNVAMTAAMLDMLGEQWDRAAAILFEENNALRALLMQGGVPAAGSAQAAETDLRVSALEAVNVELRQSLIDLQTALEQRDDAEAHALNEAIWAELRRSVERRLVASANF
jgi:hypothetical protein